MSLAGKVFKLADGHSIPAVAYGTGTKWFKFGRDELDTNLVNVVQLALAKGFTHIDGAEIYNTDLEIGEAILKSKREDLFITDKFFTGDGSHKQISPHASAYDSLKFHLEKLKTDYVDLYLIHSPFVDQKVHGFDLKEAWKSLEKAVADGLTKSIGVSNFSVDDLKTVLEVATIKPVVNQIEFNAYLQDQTPGVVEFSQKNGILVEAYSPLGPIVKGEPGELTEYLDILATKYSKTSSQVLLRWVIERGILPVTTSAKEERIAQFVDLFDFALATDEVQKITAIGKKHPTLRQYWKPEYSKYD